MNPTHPEPPPPQEPSSVFLDLRRQALTFTPEALTEHDDVGPVLSALMETTYVNGTATLAAFCDGTSSLYLSSGGGLIGAGEHAPVRRANRTFLQAAHDNRNLLLPAPATPLPPIGHVRFYIRTHDTLLTAQRPEEHLGEQRSSLSPLFNAGHRVVTQIRLVGGG